ncbi:MAG: hypothetical protein AVDCRST_MAG47-1233 [uncultured Nocardioidaceae bacterium]|uniref:Lipoprotein n=1 Tax=uncultured Nocardioidaceae bacterium TaxID=253824 RepID=A0A6J4MWW2_9ACTN|nr:MAG: hypothetical protein AVDCRST_MAG47-1233 [uncultured Nocardioidaceae bacterium]
MQHCFMKAPLSAVLATVVLSALLAGCADKTVEGGGYAGGAPTDVATATESAGEVEVAIPGDGTWRVGTDVEPGFYVAEGGEDCRWSRLGRMDVDYDDVIARGFVARPVVEIMDGDGGFHTDGCGAWTPLESYAGTVLEEVPGDGIWIVGADLEPGTYVAEGGDWCLWQRLLAFTPEHDSIIKGGSSRRATIGPDDVGFYTEGCGSWTRTG